MDDLIRLLLLKDANTRVVLMGTALLGMASGVIGSFAVLRRRALVGDAIAHAALPGLCVAYLLVGDKNLFAFLLGALAFGILGVLCISFVRTHTRIKEDAAIGLVLSTFFGFGIVLSRIIQNQPTGNRAGLDTYILGKAAAMVRQDVVFIAIVAAAVLLAVVLLFKEFRALCFDRDFAASQGWPVFWLDLILMGLLCVCTVIGLPAVGVVLMAALLIIPGAAARFWTESLRVMVVISGLIGLVSCLVGTAASALGERLPTGPLVVVAAAVCFLVSMLFAPRRGVVADLLRRWNLRRRVGSQNALRALYELTEQQGEDAGPFPFDRVLAQRSWSPNVLRKILRRSVSAGWIDATGDRFSLTEAGKNEAIRVVRAHRLWEFFLIEDAAIAPDHVDRDADQIEHVLPPELISRLEARLAREGRLPGVVPVSPHGPEEVAT
jgi:manganese/zinc/iron transport system permease protein